MRYALVGDIITARAFKDVGGEGEATSAQMSQSLWQQQLRLLLLSLE